MTTESLTYSELGDRLGSSPEAARSLARRLRLLRKPGNDGKVRVIVDLAEIQYKPVPARSPDRPQADNSALNARIEQLQAELARLEVEKNCLEASVVEHRADFERERDRCDKLMTETLVLTKVAMSARENAARLEGEVSASRGRRWWGQLIAPRRTAASRKASDRFAAARSYLNGKTDLQAWQRRVRNACVSCQRFKPSAGARRRDARVVQRAER
jgi:hypothetical protein